MDESTNLSSDRIYCHNCGTMIESGGAFCQQCGMQVAPVAATTSSPAPVVALPPDASVTYAPIPTPISTPRPLQHSGVGITSFILACAVFVIFIINIASNFFFISSSYHYLILIRSIAVMLCPFMLLAGVITGIIGVVRSNRKKLFGVLGLTFNSIMLLAPIMLVIIIALVLSLAAR